MVPESQPFFFGQIRESVLDDADNVRPSKQVKKLESEKIFVFWQSHKLGFYMMCHK
jgi:hypothetical protein